MRRHLLAILAALLAFSASCRAADVIVFAAASLTDALNEVGKDYRDDTGQTVTFSFAASSALARQIEASKGADVFISADTDWMDYLDKKNLIARDTRSNLLGNSLVLIAPANSNVRLTLDRHTDLAGALNGGKLALADPASVPAGRYGQAALKALGLWESVASAVVPAENVRVALAYVARGETPLGIVYGTDAKAEPRVRVVATFPENTHPAIVYPAALVVDAKPAARAFLAYLKGPRARAVFVKDGFTLP